MLKDIYDVLSCPKCNSEDCYISSTDELEFDVGGEGHYMTNCVCKECEEVFRLCMYFSYNVTKAYTASGSGRNRVYRETYSEDNDEDA